MIRRKRLSLLGNAALATRLLSSTAASTLRSVAGTGVVLLAAAAPAMAQGLLTEPIGSTSAPQTATITITTPGTTAGTPPAISVLTLGATGLDYVVASPDAGTCAASTPYALNATCTVKFTFSPTHPWMRYGGIALFDGSGHLLGNTFINGLGNGPQVSYPLSAATIPTSLPAPPSFPFSSPSGIAVDGSGNVYVADTVNHAVKELKASGGFVTWTGFTSPESVAVDGSGNIYVADSSSTTIIKLVAVGGIVPASAPHVAIGDGSILFSSPSGVAVDGSGNVYVADSAHDNIDKIAAADGAISTLNNMGLSNPSGVAVDGSGNVYVADTGNHAVKELLAVSGAVTPGTTPVLIASGTTPTGVAVDGAGNVYVADTGSASIMELIALAGGGVSSTPTGLGSGFSMPAGVAVDASGNVYVADTHNNLAKEMNAQTPPTLAFASTMVGYTSSDSPQTLTLANNGNAMLSLTSNSGNNPVVPTNFTLNPTSTCPQVTSTSSGPYTLAAGVSCTDVVSFTPTQAGPLTGSLTTTDNASGSPRSVSLSGTGTPAPTSLTLSPLTGSVGVDQSVTFTATVAAQSPGTIPPAGGTVNFTVTTTTASGTSPGMNTAVTLTTGTSFQFSYVPAQLGSFSVTAAYAANANFQTSTSSQSTHVVTQGSANVSVSGTASAAYGAPANFTAVVSSGGSGQVSPSGGTVTFTAASAAQSITLCNSVTLTAGSASCPISQLSLTASATPYTITAVYSNDPKFQTQSGTLTGGLTVNKATPNVTVTGPTTRSVNDLTTFSAKVVVPASVTPVTGTVIPTVAGSVNFSASDGTTLPCSATSSTLTSSTGFTYTCVVSELPLNALPTPGYTITATYAGEADYNSASGTTSLVVTPAVPAVTLSTSATSTIVNQPVTFTAVAGTVAGGIAPTGGTFTFKDGTTTIDACTTTALSTTATCTTSGLTFGNRMITAVYSTTDRNFVPGNTSSVSQVAVAAGATSLLLTASPGTATAVNQLVTYTAVVSQVTPTGTLLTGNILPVGKVTFSAAGGAVPTSTAGACTGVLISNGVYTCTTALLPLNTASSPTTPITAVFTPTETNFTPSNTATLNQTVSQDQATLTVGLGAGNNGATSVDQAATFTATITPAFATSGGQTPVGESVAFYYGGTAIPCTVAPTVVSSGNPAAYTATCTTYSLPASSPSGYPITATSKGDANITTATSNGSLVQVVNPSSYTVAVTTSEPTIVANQPSQPVFMATVTAVGSPPVGMGGVALMGKVTFTVTGGDGTATCSSPTVGTGTLTTLVATCKGSFPSNQSSSAFQVSAAYTDDVNFSKGMAPTAPAVDPVTQVVQDFTITAPATNAPVPTVVPAPTAVFVTQGYSIGSGSTDTDPLFSAVAVGAKAYNGFVDPVSFDASTACSVTATSATQGMPPTCTPPTASTIPARGFPIAFSTSPNTSPGDYTVILTGTDSSVPSLSHTTTFTVTVVPQTASSPVIFTASETVNAPFSVPSASDKFTFACPASVYNLSSSTPTIPIMVTSTPSAAGFYCAATSNPNPGNLNSKTAPFVLGNPNSVSSSQAQLKPAHSRFGIAIAATFGFPLFAIAGWLRRKNGGVERTVRLFTAVLLLVGLSQTIGCGSNGFTGTAPTTKPSTLAAGNYLVQVSATDATTGQIYYSVINLQLTAQ